jgi:hypothetical protein
LYFNTLIQTIQFRQPFLLNFVNYDIKYVVSVTASTTQRTYQIMVKKHNPQRFPNERITYFTIDTPNGFVNLLLLYIDSYKNIDREK